MKKMSAQICVTRTTESDSGAADSDGDFVPAQVVQPLPQQGKVSCPPTPAPVPPGGPEAPVPNSRLVTQTRWANLCSFV